MQLNGRYELVRQLGQGGMGTVWLARDEVMHRDVAIKELMIRQGASESSRERLVERAMREARATSRLRHPNIVRVHDVLISDDRPWIVMELLVGWPLNEMIGDGLPANRVTEIGLAVLHALRAAHAEGVVHRDVKPSNVFLNQDGRVVLADFGIAALDDEARMSRTGFPIGTPGYIAPERLHNEGRPEPSSDMFSFGCLLYAMLNGRPPFSSLGAVMTENPPPPLHLTDVVMALLEKDPAQRMDAATAEQLLASPVTGTRRPRPKNRTWFYVSLAFLVLTLSWNWFLKDAVMPEPEPKPFPTFTFTPPVIPTFQACDFTQEGC